MRSLSSGVLGSRFGRARSPGGLPTTMGDIFVKDIFGKPAQVHSTRKWIVLLVFFGLIIIFLVPAIFSGSDAARLVSVNRYISLHFKVM